MMPLLSVGRAVPGVELQNRDAAGAVGPPGETGELYVRGDQVSGTYAESEDVLIEHPEVREAAVIGIPDPEWGQLLVAVAVPAPGPVPEPDELRGHLRTALRGSRTPDRIVFRDELPTTPTGKVLRRVLVDELTPVPSNSEEQP